MSDMPHVTEPTPGSEPTDEQSVTPLPKIETGPLSPAEMSVPEPPRYSAEPTAPNSEVGFDDWLASLADAEEESSSFTPPAETGPMPAAFLEAVPLGETGPQAVTASTQPSQEPVIADPPEPEEALPDWLQEPIPDEQSAVEIAEPLAEEVTEPEPAEPAENNGIDPATLVATATAAAQTMKPAPSAPASSPPAETPVVDESAALAAADEQGEAPSWLQDVALGGGEVPVTPAPVEPPVSAKPPAPVEPAVPPAPVEEPVFAQASTDTQPQPSEQDGQFAVGRCPRCGSAELGKGTMISYGGRFRPAYYKPAGLSFWRLHNFLRPFRRLVEVEGQVCRDCGMMILQVDTDKLEKLEKKSGDRK